MCLIWTLVARKIWRHSKWKWGESVTNVGIYSDIDGGTYYVNIAISKHSNSHPGIMTLDFARESLAQRAI